MDGKQIAKLDKAYRKNFKELSKYFFGNRETGLIFFIEYLRYLRDHFIIESNSLPEEDPAKIKLATLVTAIAEFDAYLLDKDTSKKVFHWNNFCELVKLNMEDWINSNDSV